MTWWTSGWASLRQSWHRCTEPLSMRAVQVWRGFSQREQTLLRLAGVLLAGLLLWTVGVRPALDTLQTTRIQLPITQSEAAALDAVVLESRALAHDRHGVLSPAETEQALRDSIIQADLQNILTLQAAAAQDPAAGRRWVVRLEQAPAADLMAWLAVLPQRVRVRVAALDVQRSRVDGRDRPGLLSGDIVLLLPSRDMP